jgi:uncharacterized protein
VKFQPDLPSGVNVITRHEPGTVWVQAEPFSRAVLVPWSGPVQPWGVDRFEALEASHFEALLAFDPELVLFGSGPRLRFAAPGLQRTLMERRVGLETMDTAAACRTFNVLAGEGRRVVGALLVQGFEGASNSPG